MNCIATGSFSSRGRYYGKGKPFDKKKEKLQTFESVSFVNPRARTNLIYRKERNWLGLLLIKIILSSICKSIPPIWAEYIASFRSQNHFAIRFQVLEGSLVLTLKKSENILRPRSFSLGRVRLGGMTNISNAKYKDVRNMS